MEDFSDSLHGFPHSTASDVEARVGSAETSAGMSRQGLYNVLEDLTA